VGIADALFTRTQQRVLGLLFGQPEREFGVVEIIKLAGAGSGSVQRELERLAQTEIVTTSALGRQKRYRANRGSPIFEELRAIVEKIAGVPAIVRKSLAHLEPPIPFAVLYGSVAKETDRATSDVDVLIVSDDFELEELFEALAPAERRLGRRISPTLYTAEEFVRRRKAKHPFLTKVLDGKHVVLLGGEDAVVAAG
jgi:predicted nucleotidyltransferase